MCDFQIPQKDAITRAIPIIKNEWIITTDADCVVPENWLLTLDNYIQSHDVSMIVGAVSYESKNIPTSFSAIGFTEFTGYYHREFWFRIRVYVQRS